MFGTLVGDADCRVGTVLAVGASCTFTFVETIVGNVAAPHSNVVTVVVTDRDGNTGTDVDDESIAANPTTTSTSTTLPTATTLPTEVLGVQQTALPQTGTDPSRVLLAALGFLSLGAGLVLLSVYAQRGRRYEF